MFVIVFKCAHMFSICYRCECGTNCRRSHPLSLFFFKAVVTKTTADYDRWTLLKANEPTIVQMQSFWRGIMVRKEYRKKRQFLKEHEKEIVKIQAVWKGHKAHKSYKQRLEYLGQKKDQAVLVCYNCCCM